MMNLVATVCYDYEELPPIGPCECPEEEDLHLRETNASVLAMPKVDLRWAGGGDGFMLRPPIAHRYFDRAADVV